MDMVTIPSSQIYWVLGEESPSRFEEILSFLNPTEVFPEIDESSPRSWMVKLEEISILTIKNMYKLLEDT